MCNSLDLDRDGIEALFETIVTELSELENHGISVAIPGQQSIQVFGTLAQFTGDNLGFIESFSGDYNCIMCYATREEMQTFTHECDFKVRTNTEYEADLIALAGLTDVSHYRGIKRSSKLNELKYFHIIENWVNDCFHTLFEGVIPYVTGAVLFFLFKEYPNLKVESFNVEMHSIYNILIVERNNKPKEINAFLPPGDNMSPKQCASDVWAMFRYIPLILSRFVENGNNYLDLLLRLQNIVDFILAPVLTDSLLSLMSTLISEFIQQFK